MTFSWTNENVKCPENFFECTNKECIPAFKVCDSKLDCIDGFDEAYCNGKTVFCSICQRNAIPHGYISLRF